MNRRAWFLGGAGAAAAVAGGGWHLWREQRAEPDSAGLWAMRFPRPGGGELLMAAHRGRPLLLNFWATWCPPCVKEMPELDRFQTQFAARGWQVIGLAVDRVEPVREYLQRVKVGFAIGLAGFEGSDLSRRFGNTQGALPFTVAFDASGRIAQRKLGATSFDELASWAQMI